MAHWSVKLPTQEKLYFTGLLLLKGAISPQLQSSKFVFNTIFPELFALRIRSIY
jgi:hypothetical protein